MSDIPTLDAYGERLATALRRSAPGIRRRRRVATVTALLVPAAGTATDWAGLAGGETALPTQIGGELRVTLSEGRDARGRWRLEAYRAALGQQRGAVGVCVFVSRDSGGSGRCAPGSRLPALNVASASGEPGVVAGTVGAAVARVEITIRSLDRTGRRRVLAVSPAPAPTELLRERALPVTLRSFALALPDRQSDATGIRAVDEAGRTVGRVGRPAPPAPAVRASLSPATFEVRP